MKFIGGDATEKKTTLVGFGTNSGTVVATREWNNRRKLWVYLMPLREVVINFLYEVSYGNDTLLVFKGSNHENSKKI
jgi:hypothetical protein